ncbi:trypsin-like serine peptidase [Prauserella muralis]|uniref:Peptidase n=1 Tax=Prauserella muralis TaxID=588067 RepID=A0A2V4ALE3_9PSEU|nr:peptidase [Prauserella muralis]PXY19623.1 peptidase [Prauserella muralis]TWE29633.1 V8-like Glu-specific endopeptidase [Prauserella muralis]
MRRGWFRSIAVLAAGVAAAALSTPAMAEQAGVAVHTAERGAAAVTDYWTADRMRAATPLDRLLAAPGQVLGEVARGLPEVLPPVGPQASPSTGEPWTGGGEVAETAGRVFFTFNGNPASCSGNAVTSGNRSVVITAGHCVKYQGSWHTDWIFVPGYDDGAAPYGEWVARQTLTTPQWEASEDLNYDVGAAVVEPLNGAHLTDVVGGQGIAFNQQRGQDMYAFGYPAADPYDGSELIHCAGGTFTDPFTTDDHAMRCDMTGGSSGGPWFLGFDEATGTGVQASVNSFGYTFLPGYMFGPYFGSEAQALYEQAASA